MNAIKFLLKEHDKVRKMLADISEGSNTAPAKRKKFEELCDALLRHEEMEETIWYPYLKKNANLMQAIQHLISEEKMAKKSMKNILALKQNEKWEEQFTFFMEDIKQHAEEEETQLFPKVAELFGEKELDEIGKEMYQFNYEYDHCS